MVHMDAREKGDWEMKKRKYEYRVTTQITLAPGERETLVMDHSDLEWWLNTMDEEGWEFVGYAAKHWNDGYVQPWWIFRRSCS